MDESISFEKDKSIDKLVCNLIDEHNLSEIKIFKLQREIDELKTQNHLLVHKNVKLKMKINSLKKMLKDGIFLIPI